MVAVLLAACLPGGWASALAAAPTFEMHRVGTFRSEACGVGDFNADGKPDIIAGPFLYLAPEWKAVKVRELKGQVDEEGAGYMYDFANLPLDVDGDGALDLVSVSWHEKRAVWFRNTGIAAGLWPMTVIEINGNFECADVGDVNNDGHEHEILPSVRHTVWYALGKGPEGRPGFVVHTVSQKAHPFGVGAGDINGDGRADIVRPGGWYEAPEDIRQETWKEHPLALGTLDAARPDHTPQILVHDINGDGLNDILTSSAHKYGIFWYQQIREGDTPTWKQHVIDKSWSQAHNLTLADVDGDGDQDLVTGKRFKAHNGHDPGGNDPPAVYWYELKPGRTVEWIRHVVSEGEGIGAGLSIPVVDLDGDGDLDIVVTGKWGGPVWFENQRK